MEFVYKIQFFDKIKKKPKKITIKQDVKRTITASNGVYEYIEIQKFSILLEGDIKKIVINTYMKCGNIPMLWRKFYLKIANNRDHIINYSNRPFNNFDRLCREWYLSHNSDDNEKRVLVVNLKNDYMLMW